MTNYSLNCEGFTVRMGDVARPQVERGVSVRKINWSDGEYLPYEDRFYVDFGAESEKRLTMALDVLEARPRMRHRQVQEFSLPAELLRDPVDKGDFDSPIRLSRPLGFAIGRAALVGIIDFNPYSSKIGAANVVPEARNRAITIEEHHVISDDKNAGVSIVLMPEDSVIVVRQEYKRGTPDTDFLLRYLSGSREGISVAPLLGGGPEKRWSSLDDSPEDTGGSDREPRHPIVPLNSGSIELPEPPTEDIDQADGVMPFRETG